MVHVLILGNVIFDIFSSEHHYILLNPFIEFGVFIYFNYVLVDLIWVFDIKFKVKLVIYRNNRTVQYFFVFLPLPLHTSHKFQITL